MGLIPHPEGGWYCETWRAASSNGARPAGSLIHFLLETGQRSHWHRVDADEIWLWQGGDRLALSIAPDATGPIATTELGANAILQGVVPAGHWQAAEPIAGPHGYVLVSCTVMPAFDFAGFELAPLGWEPSD